MVKKSNAGKAGRYGKINPNEPSKKATAGKTKKAKFINKSGKKALVSKEVLAALKECKEEKANKREEKFEKKKLEKTGSKRKASKPDKPAEPLKKKELKNVRKSHENIEFANLMKIKKLWEICRENDIDSSKKAEYVIELQSLMQGKVATLMFKHDLARVVQLLLRLGKNKDNNFIANELLPHIRDLSKSKYGKFTVICLIKYSTKDSRNMIFKSLAGHLVKLTLHSEAVNVIDTFYNEYATSRQRCDMITEFYGKDLSLYRDLLSEHFIKVIEIYPDKKEIVLEKLLKFTQTFVEKGLTGHIIVQHLMLQYFLHGNEDTIQELVSDKFIEQAVNFVHTKEGSQIAMRCLWHCKAKERKQIIRTFKGHVKDMCINENSYMVLLAMFDCVDDTVLVKKTIISEIIENLDSITMSQFGRNVVNYLLAPRSKLFHPLVIDSLKCGDANKISKKDQSVRQQELLTYSSPGIIDNFKDNIESLLSDKARSLLINNAVNYANCDITPMFDAIIEILVTEKDQIEELTMHLVLRNVQVNKVYQKQFSDLLMSNFPNDTIIQWVGTNRGAFTVLRLLEHQLADQHLKLVEGLKKTDIQNNFNESAGRDKLIEFLQAC